MAAIKEVKIQDESVTLGQFLKICDLISSGGEAKFFLRENEVFVNEEKEDRRGRKLYENDLVKINDEAFKVCR
ncbi:MAG: S4 domain-containing protein YaaA [Erysipelotrichaceae bacterium]|nr:S4 domain-containing protein YaaA [Erysipelotrichaceae bacterium]MBQ1483223.1 S4 domain-containing protein YaaA [Erysipelotrichaceae bacterium]